MKSRVNQNNLALSFGSKVSQQNITYEDQGLQDYLTRLLDSRQPANNIISSFSYDTCLVEFIGREEQIEQLNRFIDDKRKILWWAITGLPGSGKTRLAYEFMQQCAKADDWIAKFLPWPIFVRDFFERNMTINDVDKNILVTIDYMYAYEEQIATWIEWLVAHFEQNQKLRILIIEREYTHSIKMADSVWEEFLKNGFSEPSNIYRLKFAADNLNLNKEPLTNQNAVDIINSYCKSRGKKLNEGFINQIITLATKTNDNKISPLLLMFFSEFFLEHHKNGYYENIYDVTLGKMVDRELEVIYQTVNAKKPLDKNIVKSFMVVATIISNLNIRDEVLIISDAFNIEKKKLEEYVEKFSATPLVSIANDFNEVIKGIQPDLIGEYFIYDYFKNISHENARNILNIINTSHKRELLSFLSRFLADNGERLRQCGIYDVFDEFIPEERAMMFEVVDDNGQTIVCEVLFTFESEETGKNYIVYTDNTTDYEGNIKVYASIYDPNAEQTKLLPIETEEEWKVIETIFEELQNEITENGSLETSELEAKLDAILEQKFPNT